MEAKGGKVGKKNEGMNLNHDICVALLHTTMLFDRSSRLWFSALECMSARHVFDTFRESKHRDLVSASFPALL